VERVFFALLILTIARHVLPWVAGLFVSLVIVSLGPLPPLAALFLVVVVTTSVAWFVEVRVLRAFERRSPGSRDAYDPRWITRSNKHRR